MKQVVLIHAHKDLDQLNGLVEQMADEDLIVFVNIDLKSSIDVARVHPRAHLVQRRIPIHWGDFSMVQATLHSLAEIVAALPDFDKVIFISGQDFPLLPNAVLKRELAKASARELIDCVAIGPAGWACEERLAYFHVRTHGKLAALAARAAARAMRFAGLRRRMVNGYQPYGGSAWWALSRACIVYILARVADDPAIARYFRTVDCCDEIFFQTLVMNSPFRARVLPNNFRYIQWPDGGARNPKILDAADFARIARSDAHFCRKIDPAASASLLPLLEALKQRRAMRM